jgi:hypothetical protein
MCFETETREKKLSKAELFGTPKFKPGDKVKITRKAISHENNWENSWVDFMNTAVGKIGIVKNSGYSLRHNIDVEFNGRTYGYPVFVLELVPEVESVKPIKKEFKVGDRVQVNWQTGSMWNGPGTITRIYQHNGDIQVTTDTYLVGAFDPEKLTLISTPATVPSVEITKKEQGINAAVKSHSKVFGIAKNLAVQLAQSNAIGVTNADAVQAALVKQGYTSIDLGNAAGALFRGKNWKKYNTQKSTRDGNHAREITNWQYVS